VSDDDARANAELLVTLARAHANSGGTRDDVEALYEAALRGADVRRDPVLRLRTIVRRAHYRYFRGGLSPEEEALVRSASDLLPVGEDLGRARYLLGVAASVRGDVEEAHRWLLGADAALAATTGADRARASVLDRLAWLAGARGRLREAEATYDRAADLADRAGMPANAEASRVNRAMLQFGRGRVEEAEATLRHAIRVFSLERSRELSGHASAMLAQVLFARGDLDGATRAVEDSLRTLSGSSYLPGLRAAHLERAAVALARGDLEEARSAEAEARACARRRSDAFGEALCDLARARVEAAEGHAEDAGAAFRSAWERIGRRDARALALAALAVVEAAALGLPASLADEARTSLDALPADADEAVGVARRVLPAARALSGVGGAEALEAGAAALAGEEVGERRATLRVVGRLLAAEAARRRGDAARATRERDAAADDARRLGDVLLEARLRRRESAPA
jgi:ATP/maltotriose-dependent transcriptional regulator MalT